jgi:uncharacterized membrane protein
MPATGGRLKLGIGAIALLLCLLLWNPFARAILAARMAISLRDLASGASGQGLVSDQVSLSEGQDLSLNLSPCKTVAITAVLLLIHELGKLSPKTQGLIPVPDKG